MMKDLKAHFRFLQNYTQIISFIITPVNYFPELPIILLNYSQFEIHQHQQVSLLQKYCNLSLKI